MKRRSLLAVLGIAPVAAMFPKIAAAVALTPAAPEPMVLSPSPFDGGTIVDGGRITASQISADSITTSTIRANKITIRDLDETLRVRLGLLDNGSHGVELFDAAGGKIL